MINDFSTAINEIMPLVERGDKTKPFIITRDSAYGDWQVCYPAGDAKAFLESQREYDPFALKYVGADFGGGGYAFVHDKVFCARLRAEYNAIPYGELHGGELSALINAVEDNIGSFSQVTIDYLLARENPLRELYDLNPIPLYNRDGVNGEPYIEENTAEFLEVIEYQIGELSKEAKQPTLVSAAALPENEKKAPKKHATLQEKLENAKKQAAAQDAVKKEERGDKPKKRGARE
jgi:hypothetical protein